MPWVVLLAVRCPLLVVWWLVVLLNMLVPLWVEGLIVFEAAAPVSPRSLLRHSNRVKDKGRTKACLQSVLLVQPLQASRTT